MKRHAVAMGMAFGLLMLSTLGATAREFHVSPTGDDGHNDSLQQPLKTVSAAARLAQLGDVVTIHAGIDGQYFMIAQKSV